MKIFLKELNSYKTLFILYYIPVWHLPRLEGEPVDSPWLRAADLAEQADEDRVSAPRVLPADNSENNFLILCVLSASICIIAIESMGTIRELSLLKFQ